jgi:hypothetical protein
MKRTLLALLALLTVFFFGATWVVAQEKAEEKPAAAKAEEKAVKAEAAKPETISGTISVVAADKKLVAITGSGGVPYNFKVTGSTRIKVGGKKAKLADLEGQSGKSASVKFLPLRSGNVAQSIEVQ